MRDLVIVGGGPAGLATAIFAARRGLSALVLEPRRAPLDKACGEGVMPPGVEALEELGVELAPDAAHPFAGIRFIDGARAAEARFAGRPGMGIRRTALSEALVKSAEKLGVELRFGAAAVSWQSDDRAVRVATRDEVLAGRLLVGADGLRSRVREEAGLARPWRGPLRHGVRRHFRLRPWSSFVEVHFGNGLEAYVTPVGPDLVGVALLGDLRGRSFEEGLAGFAALRARLAGAPVDSSERGAGPFRQGVLRRHAGRVALVGDAAGYLDAISGEGITLAFRSARALVDVVARGEPLERYERAYRRLASPYYRMTTLLLALSARPRLRRATLELLARSPGLFDRLLALHAGEWRPPRA